jgi:hypothetical protein
MIAWSRSPTARSGPGIAMIAASTALSPVRLVRALVGLLLIDRCFFLCVFH